MKHKQNRRMVCFILAACALLFVLTGCSGKMSGRMEIDRNFKGTRVITCSVPTRNLDRGGGTEILIDLVEKNCPPALDYEKQQTDDSLTYTFTLEFWDAASYEKLIRSILPNSALSITVGDGKLSTGIRLVEDFTDHDLMQWFDNALLASGKYGGKEDEIWEFGSSALILEGQTVCTEQPYHIDTYQGITLQSMTVTTLVAADGSIERFCDFAMDRDAYEQNKEQFAAYLAGMLPEGGNVTFSEREDGTVVETLWYGAQTAEKFSEQTRFLFGETGLFAANRDMRSAFSSETVYSEYLTFDRFPADDYRYYVKNADTAYAGLSDEYGNAILEADALCYPVENGSLSVSYSRRDAVQADAVDIAVHFGLECPESASVRITFAGSDALRRAQNAADWYQQTFHGELSASVIAVNEGYSYICAASVSGTDAVLSLLDRAFSIRLSYDMEREDRFFSDRYIISNGVEAAALYEQSGASQIAITTYLPQGMEYHSVRQSGLTIDLSGDSYTVWEPDTVFRAEAAVLRTDRLILVILLGVLLLVIAVLLAVSIARMRAGTKAGIEEGFSSVLHQSLQAVFSGKISSGADLSLIRCFYGKRGPQICVLVGIVIVPLLWSILYLLGYDYANSFYFFSGMLRYISVTIFVLCSLTIPVSLVWRYYQTCGSDAETIQAAAKKADQMAKTEIARMMNCLRDDGRQPQTAQDALIPDAFVKRSTAARRLLAKILRQFSRKFPDVESPVVIRCPEEQTVVSSRSLLQNVLLYEDRIEIHRRLLNPAFGTCTALEDIRIAKANIRTVRKDIVMLTARYLDGRIVRLQKCKYFKITLITASDERYCFYLPDTEPMIVFLQTLQKACCQTK